jgi:hypothetical protein
MVRLISANDRPPTEFCHARSAGCWWNDRSRSWRELSRRLGDEVDQAAW